MREPLSVSGIPTADLNELNLIKRDNFVVYIKVTSPQLYVTVYGTNGDLVFVLVLFKIPNRAL